MASTVETGTDVMGTIGLAMTLMEYFPDKLWESLKGNAAHYNSALSLILAALHSVGFNENTLLAFIIDNIAGEENVTFANAEQKFSDLKEQIISQNTGEYIIDAEEAMTSLSQQEIIKSDLLNSLETGVKVLLEGMLTSLFTCSVDPLIPDYAFTDGFTLPLEIIDPTGMLKIAPNSLYGGYTYFDCNTINGLTGSTDFNAFLWYVINRADGEVEWKMPTTNEVLFYVSYSELTDSISIRLNPNRYKNKRKIANMTFNKTIYEFNHEYLKTQELYNPYIFIGGVLKAYLDAARGFETLGHISVSFYEKEIEQKISQIIKNIVNSDDGTINDCFYTFSNDDYNTMLENIETERMGGVKRNNAVTTVLDIDETSLMENLNTLAQNTGNLEDYKTQLTSTVMDVVVEQGEDGYIEDGVSVSIPTIDAARMIEDLLNNLISTCIRTIVSPKVLALIMINYGTMGLGLPTAELLLNRITTILVKVVRYVVNEIVKLLYDLFKEYVIPLITKLAASQFVEQLNSYLELLDDILQSCPWAELGNLVASILLSLKKTGLLTQIDDVNYADILPNSKNNDNQEC